MLITETIIINNAQYTRTWSDSNKMIEREGTLYESALDLTHLGRTYTETDQDIPDMEAEEPDYLAALDKLGVTASDEE